MWKEGGLAAKAEEGLFRASRTNETHTLFPPLAHNNYSSLHQRSHDFTLPAKDVRTFYCYI